MNDYSEFPKLSFFKVEKYLYNTDTVSDFSNIPRPHFCMGLILRGTGDFRFGKQNVTVRKGDIIFVPVGTTYISNWKCDPDVLYISIHFSFDFPSPFSYNTKMDIQKITMPDFQKIKDDYENLLDLYENQKQNIFSVIASFFAMMGEIFPYIQYITSKPADERISKAVDYIQQYYTQNISVKSLAALCNMSTSNFYTRFKEAIGMSPTEYKQTVWINNAKLMLIDKNKMSIEDISEALGFHSAIYFRRLFKKLTGKTPTQYRQSENKLHFRNGI